MAASTPARQKLDPGARLLGATQSMGEWHQPAAGLPARAARGWGRWIAQCNSRNSLSPRRRRLSPHPHPTPHPTPPHPTPPHPTRPPARAAWQHPFVNVFKLCDVERWRDVERQGEVKAQMVGAPRRRR
jgi:hypothetical protein